jgi:hypothetical protein
MEKMTATSKPEIALSVDQAETVVRFEMMWHLQHMEIGEKKIENAMKRVLKYYSTAEQYKDFMDSLEDN